MPLYDIGQFQRELHSEGTFQRSLYSAGIFQRELHDIGHFDAPATTEATGFNKATFISTYGLSEVWWLDELTGITATAGVLTPTRDGTYTGVSLNNADGPAGTGMRAGLWDGIQDVANIYTASLDGIFSGTAGGAFIAGKVSGAGVWTDGGYRRLLNIEADGSNRIFLSKSNINSQIYAYYIAGGTQKYVNTSTSTADWFTYAITWDKTADEVKVYFNGSQTGNTQTGLGVWAGSLLSTGVAIGARITTPSVMWSGWLQVCALKFGAALSAANVLAMHNEVMGL